MSRKYRNLSNETKALISKAMRGKQKTDAHKHAISVALKEYWRTIPYKNNDNTAKGNE